jgi:hypothetical protein
LNERKAYFSLRLILAAVRQRHRSEIAPLAISVRPQFIVRLECKPK